MKSSIPLNDWVPQYLRRIVAFLIPVALLCIAGQHATAATELISNGGFESGSTGWTWTSANGINPASLAYGYAHSGSYYLWLGDDNGVDTAYQTITIPSTATSAILSFYYNMNTSQTSGAPDTFSATIRNTSGTILATVGSWSNLNGTSPGNPYYYLKSFDLSTYAGQTIRIYFLSTCTLVGSKTTNFRVDDVSVQVITASSTTTTTSTRTTTSTTSTTTTSPTTTTSTRTTTSTSSSAASTTTTSISSSFSNGARIMAIQSGGYIPNVRNQALDTILFQQVLGVHGTIVGVSKSATAGGYTGNWWDINWDSGPPQSGQEGWSAEVVIKLAPVAGDILQPNLLGSYYASSANIFWAGGFAPYWTSPPTPQLGSAEGNCTWYAYGRMLELGANSTQLSALHGNAGDWATAASGVFPVDSTPTVHSIAQTTTGNHVAVVESINGDGTITVTESSYVNVSSSAWNIRWHHRTVAATWFENFIHVTFGATTTTTTSSTTSTSTRTTTSTTSTTTTSPTSTTSTRSATSTSSSAASTTTTSIQGAGIAVGDYVRCQAWAPARIGAGTSYSEVTSSYYSAIYGVNPGSVGLVTAGPTNANGFTWWQVTWGQSPMTFSGWSAEVVGGQTRLANVSAETRPCGVDVSTNQGAINWQTVKNTGHTFAFVKATEGDNSLPLIIDGLFTQNMAQARAAGVLVGAYHYAYPARYSATNEAHFFLSVARNYITNGYLRPVLDVEVPISGTTNYSAWVDTWIQTVKNETGVEPIVYTYPSYATTHLNASLTKYRLWMANWLGDINDQPDTAWWTTWDFWQYNGDTAGVPNDEAMVPGIAAKVDVDVFNGTLSSLMSQFVIGQGQTTTTTTSSSTTSSSTSTTQTTTSTAGTTTTSIPPGGLGDAVDAPALTWSTGGNANWFWQAATTHDGADAVQSGAITDLQTNWVQTTVTGPGTLSYWWRVSSESNCDYLTFLYDGYEQTGSISGESGWMQQSWLIPAGTHSARWVYSKDVSASSGSDCGWLDQVVWTPDSSTTTTISTSTTQTTTSTAGTTSTSIGTTTISTTTRTTTSTTTATTSTTQTTTTRTTTSTSNPSSSTTTTILPPTVIVDNNDGAGSVTVQGAWSASAFAPGYWGTNYLHDGNTDKGTKNVTFRPNLPTNGVYTVSVWYPAQPINAVNVPMDIVSEDGAQTVVVNQQLNGGMWFPIGTNIFAAGTTGYVTIRTSGTANYVIADAVKFAWVGAAAPLRSTVFINNGEGQTQGIVIRWPSISNRFYILRRATNLFAGSNDFIILPGASNLPGTPDENSYTDAVQGVGPYFYRISRHE